MMTVDEAFRAGMQMARDKGMPISGSDVQIIAAMNTFERAARGKEFDPRFPEQGPQYAYRLIIFAYASPAGYSAD